MKVLIVFLPLPQSKNERKTSRTYFCQRRKRVVSEKVISGKTKEYFLLVNNIFNKLKTENLFTDKKETFIICDWKVPDMRKDTVNFHDDISDAIQKGINVNDRYFLLFDRSRVISKDEMGVIVTIIQDIDKNKSIWEI